MCRRMRRVSGPLNIAADLSLISCSVTSTRTQAEEESRTQDGDPACDCDHAYGSRCALARVARLTDQSGVNMCGTDCPRRV